MKKYIFILFLSLVPLSVFAAVGDVTFPFAASEWDGKCDVGTSKCVLYNYLKRPGAVDRSEIPQVLSKYIGERAAVADHDRARCEKEFCYKDNGKIIGYNPDFNFGTKKSKQQSTPDPTPIPSEPLTSDPFRVSIHTVNDGYSSYNVLNIVVTAPSITIKSASLNRKLQCMPTFVTGTGSTTVTMGEEMNNRINCAPVELVVNTNYGPFTYKF